MKRRSNENDCEVPLSALIDVVFLLIIFFIVTANLQKEVVDFEITLADSYHVEPPIQRDPRTLTINIRTTKNKDKPLYSIRGSRYELPEIKSRLYNMSKAHGQDAPIIIRASRDLEYRYVDRINLLVTDVGLYRVQHATTAHPKDKAK